MKTGCCLLTTGTFCLSFFLSIQRSLRGVLESHLSLYGTIMSLLNVMWNCTFCQCLLIRESFMALLHVVRVRLLWNSPCCCSPFTVMYICQFCFHGFCTCSVPSMAEWIGHEKKSKWQNFRCKITLWVWKWIFFLPVYNFFSWNHNGWGKSQDRVAAEPFTW